MADGGSVLSAEIRQALKVGDDALARRLMLDPEALLKARAVIESDAKAARGDVCRFFEFVMREETTKARLKIQPHQEVFFRFVMDHVRSVEMLPVGHSKTMAAAALTLKFLGDDPTTRGVFVSGAQEQAMKPLAMVSDYIGDGTEDNPGSPELRLVYPNLKRARRGKWTETAITVERPRGIRDPSVRAVGFGGNIQGSRLSWIVVDDLLNAENTATKESMEKVLNWFFNSVLTRLDPKTGRIIVINTAWHPDDLVHKLEAKGWATLRMAIDGDVKVQDDVRNVEADLPPWDHPELVPKNDDPTDDTLVLRSNPPGVLFPARHTLGTIEELREDFLPKVFNQMFRNVCRDDESAMCKREWVDLCLENARRAGIHGFSAKRRANGACFTGVDLAVSPGEESDDCSFFTFEVLPSGHRLILDVDVGKFDGPQIVQKCIEKSRWYDSILVVENNGCFVPGTNVLTRERGYVPIETVEPGEYVWTHKARWKKVLERLEGFSKTVVEGKVAGCLGITATPEHPFWMREAGRVSGRGGGQHRPVTEPTWVSVGFADKPAYVAVAIPEWPEIAARIELPKTNKRAAIAFDVDEEFAFLLGLYAAEGHSTKSQACWTLSASEDYVADFIEEVVAKRFPGAKVTRAYNDGAMRVTANGYQIAALGKKFGVGITKGPPIEWMGWPLELRLAFVRGWLLGDGCLQVNNPKTDYPSQFFSGSSISRNLAMFVRATLMQAGYRPTMSKNAPHQGRIGERVIRSKESYTVRLCAEDSHRLRASMMLAVEAGRWRSTRWSGVPTRSPVVFDGDHAWSRLKAGPGQFQSYAGKTYNLHVEDDESYVVEDVVVHNCQEFVLQFTRAQDVSIPLKSFTTGRNKAHPEHGVHSIFVEMKNGAWLLPNDKRGRMPKQVERFVQECLYYQPSKHTGDVLMSCFFARDQARKWGALGNRSSGANVQQGSFGTNLMAR